MTDYTTQEELEEDVPDARPIDPEIQKKIDLLMKMGDSGAAKALMWELERKGRQSPTLDPISASRTPAADKEPHYKTRYDCPVFAC